MNIKKIRGTDVWVVNGIEIAAKTRWQARDRYWAKLEGDNVTLRAKLASTYELVDGLKDMLAGGRLTGSDIPDDFDWLHQQIDKIERNRA